MLSYLELVELANGDIVLQRSEGDENPLVTIKFSKETREHITGSVLDVARAMVQAGIEAAAVSAGEENYVDDDDFDDQEPEVKTVH
ncbi:Uncharacterised protein [Zhongshania aliphaticivorans]|uniref:Uncharacterized protein n=1 Tax=Zhongshania aliphaticivorans TaxID=1470434 RepID=A0A5S9NF78_9GAMM|nr:hypothetical protein [Zhongshania aliphaticivorans]CAA0088296.1 Uncharacterised protein [Zhongshania aliphaticivorans]CAA0116298.1 Uncharacterised protein [Zhongshania aliphaticivorans]CAA0120414.1 Uncharacterised protein [Zhongshania aliphaticivorans]